MNSTTEEKISKPNSESKPEESKPTTEIEKDKKKTATLSRRNRQIGKRINRQRRLHRAKRVIKSNKANIKRNGRRRSRRFGFNNRRNLRLRKVFVGGLPRSINSRGLYNLFKFEGKVISSKIIYNRYGVSLGFGELEFANPRDAWKVIRKWNNTYYRGFKLRVQYRKRKKQRKNNRSNRKYSNDFRRGGKGFNNNYRTYYNYGGFQSRWQNIGNKERFRPEPINKGKVDRN